MMLSSQPPFEWYKQTGAYTEERKEMVRETCLKINTRRKISNNWEEETSHVLSAAVQKKY